GRIDLSLLSFRSGINRLSNTFRSLGQYGGRSYVSTRIFRYLSTARIPTTWTTRAFSTSRMTSFTSIQQATACCHGNILRGDSRENSSFLTLVLRFVISNRSLSVRLRSQLANYLIVH